MRGVGCPEPTTTLITLQLHREGQKGKEFERDKYKTTE